MSSKVLKEYIKQIVKKSLKEGKDYTIVPYPDELNVSSGEYGFRVHSIEVQKKSLDMLHGFERFDIKFFVEIGNNARGYDSKMPTKQIVPLDSWIAWFDKDESIIVNIEKENTYFGLVARRTLSQNEIDFLKRIIIPMMQEN